MIKHTTEVFQPTFSDTVIAELDTRFSRRLVDMAPSEGPLPFGLVLCRDNDGIYGPLKGASESAPQTQAENGQAENGQASQKEPAVACAILIAPLDASASGQKGLVIGGYAIINPDRLVWDASVTDKKTALGQLEARGLVFREVSDGDAK